MASLASQLTSTLSSLIFATTGVIVAVPSAAQAAQPRPWPVVVFEGSPETGSQVVVAGAYGNRQRRLTSGPSVAMQPRWSPSGKRILYLRQKPNGRVDLMVMGAYGRNKHQVMSGKNRHISDMAWGPGGGRVALVMSPHPTADFADVVVYSLRTRKLTNLHADHFPDRDPTTLDWSRDGKTIAFAAIDRTEDDAADDSDLYLIRPNGTGMRQITNTNPRGEGFPRLSPNGRQLAYTTASGSDTDSIMIAAADGTNPRRLRTGPDAAYIASWSPRGRQLLVEKDDRQGSKVIWRMNANGSHRRYLTHGRNAHWRPR